ncbi:hypothetical protein CHF27_002985 [Romboutsia maritimum]|uniref:Uncharacterized protein n=1 Tax=Romboutsia maritimum TaxID=2020948 RepID=A0A371IV32_9FIRM|nr:hypothetical protein [Romboutsia maritimum]RDY24336.1 hypothetical protein CHF27_002985 [Romboutsia maritimum]
MMNNINNNSYNRNLYGKSQIKSSNEIKQIQNKLLPEINIEELPKEELIKLNKFQNEEFVKLFKKIQEQIKEAELIAIKIVKGEKLTAEEQRFIREKYPDMKQTAEQSIKESKDLKEELKSCKTDGERQKLLSNAISDVKDMAKKGALSEIQVRIKMSGVEEVAKSLKKIQEQVQKAELIAVKIVKGEKLTAEELRFIREKYPDMKQTAEQSIKECKNLRQELKNCKTDGERQKILSNAISDVEDMAKKGVLSKVEVRIKMLAIEEVVMFSKKIPEQIKKAELIAIKIVKGEKLTSKEVLFISEEYPDMKQIAEQSIKECKDLKEELKNCKTNEERQKVLSNAINDVEDMAKKGILSEVQVRIRMSAIEEVKKEDEKMNNKEKEPKFYINPYIYINSGEFLDKLAVIMIIVVIIIGILYIF